ncbi:Dihydrofolate reductase [Defluviimonas aquaemixtae]|uniref:Dihydrofolate reductase n=1 Tax=Albidovulum aquaemixtae TaxID=1542388 RepID=A0A2R8BNH3_9RHOB|nr:dihydrofolate reductase family protein [Defluviimonas aquaemixtae]SPH24923.1 Dihydrofolate reductase [Defluviimonas aquaemixtae]
MTTGHVFMAMSLDGFIARADHSLDWLLKHQIEGEDHGYDAFEASVDGIVMGSGSFRAVLKFGEWPYRKPVIVLSQSLSDRDVPKHLSDRVTISRSTPSDLMRERGASGWSRVYVDGGKVVQKFLRDGLVEDLRITIIPILIGSGIRLFGELDHDLALELVAAKPYPSGLLGTHYKVSRK